MYQTLFSFLFGFVFVCCMFVAIMMECSYYVVVVCVKICDGQREYVGTYSLKQRNIIGNLFKHVYARRTYHV